MLNVQKFTVEMDTLSFQIMLENLDTAKEIGDVSLKSTEYKSVLMLPICNAEDEVRYYAISDDHFEYYHDNVWKLSKIHIDSIIGGDLHYTTDGVF